jgi:hypothetical protein
MSRLINVIKATGEVEPFSEKRVIGSLLRAGASPELAQKIVSQVKPHLYQNIPSFEIYSLVMGMLKKEERSLAEKYNLKRAIMELGPTGYPFEKYVAEVLKVQNYQVQINQLVAGRCVTHEIDIVAKNDKTYMIECKFHAQVGGRTDVKEALYTYARFLDIKEKGFAAPWLITNNKVTQEAKAYALCVGMRVTSWDYPAGESLREMIDKSQLHPITASTILSAQQKQALLEKGVVFCHQSETGAK